MEAVSARQMEVARDKSGPGGAIHFHRSKMATRQGQRSVGSPIVWYSEKLVGAASRTCSIAEGTHYRAILPREPARDLRASFFTVSCFNAVIVHQGLRKKLLELRIFSLRQAHSYSRALDTSLCCRMLVFSCEPPTARYKSKTPRFMLSGPAGS